MQHRQFPHIPSGKTARCDRRNDNDQERTQKEKERNVLPAWEERSKAAETQAQDSGLIHQ
jgi:hypothetical protein